MAELADGDNGPRSSIIETTISYLLIQAFLYMLIANLPWPVVGYETWGGHQYSSVTPRPVWLFYWAQLAVGLFLPVRGKAFLLTQYLIFAIVFLLMAEVEGTRRYGTAVVHPSVYTVYRFQFCATAVGAISWQYRKSKALSWYPLVAYFVVQLAVVWCVSEIRMSVGTEVGTWILLVFVVQCIGLLFAPSQIRLFVSIQVLLGISIPLLQRWTPEGWHSLPDSVSDILWIVYFLQCVGSSWWLFTRRIGAAKT